MIGTRTNDSTVLARGKCRAVCAALFGLALHQPGQAAEAEPPTAPFPAQPGAAIEFGESAVRPEEPVRQMPHRSCRPRETGGPQERGRDSTPCDPDGWFPPGNSRVGSKPDDGVAAEPDSDEPESRKDSSDEAVGSAAARDADTATKTETAEETSPARPARRHPRRRQKPATVSAPEAGTAEDGTTQPEAAPRLKPTAASQERYNPESWFEQEQPQEQEADDGYPRVMGYSDLNIEYDTTLGESFDDTLVNITSEIDPEFSPTLFMTSDVRIILDGEDDGLRRYNTDLPFNGVYIRELKLQKETDKYALFGGKFEPAYRIFGYAPIFFGNFATDFNLEERAGVGGSLFFDKTANSEVALTAQAFYLDKSRLSGEIFSGKARDGITNGQIGDTGRLNNYLVTLNGGITNWDPGLRWTIGAGRQEPGDEVEKTEEAVLGSIYQIHRLAGGGDVEFSLDLLSVDNADGFNENTDSITVGGGYSDWPAYAGLAYSVRDVQYLDDGSERRDRIVEVVLRKGITESTLVEAAYQYSDAWDEVEKNFGIVFRYYTDWSLD